MQGRMDGGGCGERVFMQKWIGRRKEKSSYWRDRRGVAARASGPGTGSSVARTLQHRGNSGARLCDRISRSHMCFLSRFVRICPTACLRRLTAFSGTPGLPI